MQKEPPATRCGRGLPLERFVLKTVRKIVLLVVLLAAALIALVFPGAAALFVAWSLGASPLNCAVFTTIVEACWAVFAIREMRSSYLEAKARDEQQHTRLMPAVTTDGEDATPPEAR